MIPVVSPDEMRAVDAAAPDPVEVLIARAGAAVARVARTMLGGTYGRRVIVVAGPGNNGADGRAAARRLRERGMSVHVVDVDRETPPPATLGRSDLVIDAAYGTGFHGHYIAPDAPGALVVAVDIPSGVDGLTGAVAGGSAPMRADATVTFAAYKPGLIFGAGAELAGRIIVAEIGLSVAAVSTIGVVEEDDVRRRLPRRRRDDHKWRSAVLVVGGSAGMLGAPALAAAGAQRAGAGMVRVAVPGANGAAGSGSVGLVESVGVSIPLEQWSGEVLINSDRCGAVVIGPGLGRSGGVLRDVRTVLAKVAIPIVVDADALAAIGADVESTAQIQPERATPSVSSPSVAATPHAARRPKPADPAVRAAIRAAFAGGRAAVPAVRPAAGDPAGGMSPGQRAVLQATARRMGAAPHAVAQLGTPSAADLEAAVRALGGRLPGTTVLTPHDGEFALVTGRRPDDDRIADARRLAASTGAVVLLKGPTTIVAAPDGHVELVTEGDTRLATAGSGDVLSGIIAAFLAHGLEPLVAASTAAWVHGRAGRRGAIIGMTAGDLPSLVAIVCSELVSTGSVVLPVVLP